MKFFKTIILILISFCIFNLANAKDFVKVYKQDEISKYFSGVISLNDNEYGNSYIYLKKLDGFETSHFNFSQLFQYTLINLGKFDEAYIYSKKLERKKIQTFESNLIIGVFYLKRGDYKNAAKYFKKLEDKNQTFLLQSLLSESLNAWILFPKLTQNEAREKIKNISNTFENVKKIQETFSYCFYNNNKTDIQFEKLISDSKIDFTRYSFFYANFLFKKGKTDKANKIIDSSLKKFPRNLILGQMKDDMESKKIKHFSNKFDCENLSNVIAELFYIISNVTSTQNMYSISNFYLSLAKFLNPNFISFDTFITVDSKPIFERPPSNINLTFLPNSSITSLAETGLILDDIFALGMARGKFIFFISFFISLCFGNLIAIVSKFALASGQIFDFFFFFKI